MRLTRQEHEEIAKQILTHHVSCANSVSKITVCHFVKQGILRQTVYDVLNVMINAKQQTFHQSLVDHHGFQVLLKSFNNKTGIRQRRLA